MPRSPEMRSSFNQLLVALSVIDSLYVITGIVDYSLVKVIVIAIIIIITWKNISVIDNLFVITGIVVIIIIIITIIIVFVIRDYLIDIADYFLADFYCSHPQQQHNHHHEWRHL